MSRTGLESLTGEKAIREGFCYKNVGYGMTSYEKGHGFDESYVENGKVFTPTFDSQGLEWDSARKAWKFDSGLGLVSYIVNADDTEMAQYIKKYGSLE